jgi:hypothetical protein
MRRLALTTFESPGGPLVSYGEHSVEIEKLRAVIRDTYEAWCGSELPEKPEAKTAPEAYAYHVISNMLEELRRGLGPECDSGQRIQQED